MSDDELDLEGAWADVRAKAPDLDLAQATLIDPDKLRNEVTSPGGIITGTLAGDYVSGEPEFVGRMPVRTELTVLSADPPREPLGWTFRELTDEDLAERDSPENLRQLAREREATSPEVRAFQTNHAATFPPDPPMGYEGMYAWPASQGSMSLTVLPELTGRPWNNAAANFLVSLRPSAVRVTYGAVTADSYAWRVTVTLNRDNTIQRISQEVSVGLTGFRNGWDASNYLNSNHEPLGQPQPTAFFNPRGIRRMELFTDGRETIPAAEILFGDILLEGEDRWEVGAVTLHDNRVEFMADGRVHSYPLDEPVDVILGAEVDSPVTT
jgi:hypothetical protein